MSAMIKLTQRDYVLLGYPRAVATVLPILIDPDRIKAIGPVIHTDSSMGVSHRLDGSWIQHGDTMEDCWYVRETPDQIMAIWDEWKAG